MKSYRAFLFDLDGTLVDSNEAHVESWQRAFQKFGKLFAREELRVEIGKGSDQYLPSFLSEDEMDEFGKKLERYRTKLFTEEYLPKIKPFPKVFELFSYLKELGANTMVVTSGGKTETKYYLKLLQIRKLVDGFTTASDVKHSKPSPELFEAALAKLGLPASQAVAIGDTRFDMEAAVAAGIDAVGLLCGGTAAGTLRITGAKEIFRSPADLLSRLRRAGAI